MNAIKLSSNEATQPRSRPSRMTVALLACTIAGMTGCAAQVDRPGSEQAAADDSNVGSVEAPVLNGASIPGDDFNAFIRIWAFNTKFNEFRQFCSGVLLRNNVVLTAAHCLRFSQADFNNGWPDVHANTSAIIASTDRANFAAFGLGAPAFAPDGRDLAAFKLQANLPVVSFGVRRDSGWFHQLGGTPPAHQVLAVVGYGPSNGDLTSTVCNYVSLNTGKRTKGCLNDPLLLNFNLGQVFQNGTEFLTIGVTSTNGDSGGPTLMVINNGGGNADLPLVGINSLASRCVPLSSSNCGAVSARLDDLNTWLAALQ